MARDPGDTHLAALHDVVLSRGDKWTHVPPDSDAKALVPHRPGSCPDSGVPLRLFTLSATPRRRISLELPWLTPHPSLLPLFAAIASP